jgi:GNAT superfamily N-acetyltransferase
MTAVRGCTATITVCHDAELPLAAREAVRRLLTQAFPGIDIPDYERRHQDRVALAFVGEELVGQAAFLTRTITVGGTAIRVVGLGGVATEPAKRGRGIGGRLVAEAIAHAQRGEQHDFGFLQCPPDIIGFYESIGWQQVDAPVFERNGHAREAVPYPAMVRSLAKTTWPDGEIHLRGARW